MLSGVDDAKMQKISKITTLSVGKQYQFPNGAAQIVFQPGTRIT